MAIPVLTLLKSIEKVLYQFLIYKKSAYGVKMQHLEEVKNILCNVLSIPEREQSLTEDSRLLGNIPELDSMAVVNVIVALEEHFDITIDDDEINSSIFVTLGSLTGFVDQKLAQ